MAQQSARRGRKNQGFPQCLEHALGDLDPARELPYRPAADHRCTTGRTDGSIRLRATAIRKFSLAKKGASTDATADIPERPSKALPIIQTDGCTNCCLGTWSRSGAVWISGKLLKRLLSMHHVLNASKAAAAN